MSGVLVGTVVEFGSKDYGFIKCEDKDRDIFFHLRDHREFHVGGGAVFWRRNQPLRNPRPGDVVVLQIKKARDGRMSAIKWGIKDDYDKAQLVARGKAT